jgi:hypothetical protein
MAIYIKQIIILKKHCKLFYQATATGILSFIDTAVESLSSSYN